MGAACVPDNAAPWGLCRQCAEEQREQHPELQVLPRERSCSSAGLGLDA